jgi:hypothetical protein
MPIDITSTRRVLQLIDRAAHTRGLATLATIDRAGGGVRARARTVVLRRYSEEKTGGPAVAISTHAAAGKVAQVRATPAGELVLWQEPERVQIRARVTIRVVDARAIGTAAALRENIWQGHSDEVRATFFEGTPGDAMPRRPSARTPAACGCPAPATFALLLMKIETLDVLALTRPRHRRALHVRRGKKWTVREVIA